jgi:hypothetical protein
VIAVAAGALLIYDWAICFGEEVRGKALKSVAALNLLTRTLTSLRCSVLICFDGCVDQTYLEVRAYDDRRKVVDGLTDTII